MNKESYMVSGRQTFDVLLEEGADFARSMAFVNIIIHEGMLPYYTNTTYQHAKAVWSVIEKHGFYIGMHGREINNQYWAVFVTGDEVKIYPTMANPRFDEYLKGTILKGDTINLCDPGSIDRILEIISHV